MPSEVLTAGPAALCHKKPRGAPPAPQTRISANFLNIALRQRYHSQHAGSHCKNALGKLFTGRLFREKDRGRTDRKETVGERFKQNEAEEGERAWNKWRRANVEDWGKEISGKGEQKEQMRMRGKKGTERQRGGEREREREREIQGEWERERESPLQSDREKSLVLKRWCNPPSHFSLPLTTGVACLCSSRACAHTHTHTGTHSDTHTPQSNVQPSKEAGARGNAKCLLPWLLPVAGRRS